MNVTEILKNGHLTVLRAVDGLAERDWYTPGVCGSWSVRDIIAHLASFELALVDVLNTQLKNDVPTPTLDKFIADYEFFNNAEVEARQHHRADEVLAEYIEANATAAELLAQIPVAQRRQNGTLPWYGEAYDLEDFIVYTFYGHKQEHCAQIGVFRSELMHKVVAT